MGSHAFRLGVTMLALLPTSTLAEAGPGVSNTPIKTEAIKLPQTEPVVCRREPVLGSHFTKRVCRTRSQIEEERLAAKDTLRALNSKGTRARNASAQ